MRARVCVSAMSLRPGDKLEATRNVCVHACMCQACVRVHVRVSITVIKWGGGGGGGGGEWMVTIGASGGSKLKYSRPALVDRDLLDRPVYKYYIIIGDASNLRV